MVTLTVLPDVPSLVAGHSSAALCTPDGELFFGSTREVANRLAGLAPPLVVHAPATFRRLGIPLTASFDLLELFAFVLPGQSAAPTVRGLCRALDFNAIPASLEDEAELLPDLATALLLHLSRARDVPANRSAAGLAAQMAKAGWSWAVYVMEALGQPGAPAARESLQVWKHLPEWEDTAPRPPASAHPVNEAEARAKLSAVLGPHAEQRPGQSDYAGATSAAFRPRHMQGDPNLVLAEAGTGTGKTLGYLAPASLWAERNKGSVWISTFTRHLQRQIDDELKRLYGSPKERRDHTVVRKGRENYLCLLNLEDAVNAATGPAAGAGVIPLGLLVRWAAVTEDGDLNSGDLPGWLGELYPSGFVGALADRRGECIYSGCNHWRRCFIERTVRRSRTADLVVANHALVMAQAALGGLDDAFIPDRYVFDEGHHIFDAADAAFATVLSGGETAELRRWLLGAEGGRSRARGLRRRVEELVAGRPRLELLLDRILQAARILPAPGWLARLTEAESTGTVKPNPSETFFARARRQALARMQKIEADTVPTNRAGLVNPQSGAFECDVHPLDSDILEAADDLASALGELAEPITRLRQELLNRIDEEADSLDPATVHRIEAVARSLTMRALNPLTAWQSMLGVLHEPESIRTGAPLHVLFFRVVRRDSLFPQDVGLHRHWLDPTIPFAMAVAAPSQGVLVTSATLRDSGQGDTDLGWESAESRVGATHLPSPAIRVAVGSPFDYAAQTRAFVVTDVAPNNPARLAAAFRTLFMAAGGGGLGLFTAIRRLQDVHARIAPDLEASGIPLFAQHVDAMGNNTLVDIFRTEENSCLLGTDAMRDGVDVPGRALRIVVFEKIPWPRPDILHRERRLHLSQGQSGSYDDRIVRMRLRQAFGRLIRRVTDRGVFVLLDGRAPSRLMTAFPVGVTVKRMGLAEAVQETRAFLEEDSHPG